MVEILYYRGIDGSKRIAPLLDEAEQLIRIVASSVITAKSKSRRASNVK
jgi:hypothetical protein